MDYSWSRRYCTKLQTRNFSFKFSILFSFRFNTFFSFFLFLYLKFYYFNCDENIFYKFLPSSSIISFYFKFIILYRKCIFSRDSLPFSDIFTANIKYICKYICYFYSNNFSTLLSKQLLQLSWLIFIVKFYGCFCISRIFLQVQVANFILQKK